MRQPSAATDPRKSTDNIALLREIAALREKHAKLSTQRSELTDALDHANKKYADDSDRIRSFNVEMAVREKEMREMQGHIFALKKRRAMAGSDSSVADEFNRQERLLNTLSTKHSELSKVLLEIESNMKLYSEVMADKTATLQRVSMNLGDREPKRNALADEVAALEAAAKIFIEAERLDGELGVLTDQIAKHTSEIKSLKAYIAEAEPEAAALETEIGGLEKELSALEQANKEIKELTAQKAAMIDAVEQLEDQDKALALDNSKSQRDLDKLSETLKERKAVNETNKAAAPAIEAELRTYSAKISDAKINLTKYGELKKKRDMELQKFENALNAKLELETEILLIEEGTAALGEIARSVQ